MYFDIVDVGSVAKLFFSIYVLVQVDSAWSSGNYEEAQRNANISKILNIIGFVIGILTWVAVIVAVVVDVALASQVQTIRGS